MTDDDSRTCPACGSGRWGEGTGRPVEVGGWYGDRHFSWGRYAGVHLVKLTALRCADCGHVRWIPPDWDRGG